MKEFRQRLCIYGCESLFQHGVPLHRFPNPEKHPDVFAAWVSVVGDKLNDTDSQKIYKTKRVCDHHFDPVCKIPNGRLFKSAIPTINLNCVQQSSLTHVESDHSYCRPKRDGLLSMENIKNVLEPSIFQPLSDPEVPLSAVDSAVFSIPSGSTVAASLTSNTKCLEREECDTERWKSYPVEKRRGNMTESVLLFQDNTLVHKIVADPNNCGFEPLYSPDLAPSYYF